MKKIISIFSVAVTVLAFAATSSCAQDLVILHTNDTHSQIEPENAGPAKGLGGYERRENFINSVRKENKHVLLMDAGDFSQGTPYFTLYKGDVEIELMNALKYDVACIGNHEYDNGQEELARRIKNAHFPVLCANYDFSKTPLNDVVKPYAILHKAGKKIGVIGLSVRLRGLVSPATIANMEFLHPYKIVNKYAAYLKNQEHCDLVIVLSHCGMLNGSEQNPSDDMIAQNTENVDFIIGGHSHTYIEQQRIYKNKAGKDVVVVQDGERGEHIARLNIWF
ncbi:MAG: metallophosphoesterase [Bacteroidales bacterium]|jgi:5'-nucleotidase|nr:metallophosphoesterase [Bacteroidales bacterium]MCI1733187.1 metallophosphoesterase [Bacteroidales bacterium]